MRALLLFLIGLAFGFGSGFLIGGGLGEGNHSHDHAGHSDAAHDHATLTEWTGEAPGLSLILTPDMGDARNLEIITTGFAFDPRNVNGTVTPGTGHAHVYVNGTKITRAYAPFVHLENVKPGDIIRVTLNANDHSAWGLNKMPIAKEVTVE